MNINGVMESAVRRIREEIITGSLPAGSRLHETELSERFGISRPPLREAFRTLANENLVVSIPRRGSFVAPMSREDCEHIYRARLMLERTAIDLLGQESRPGLALLREALEEARRPDAPRTTLECFSAMSRFHRQLIAAAGNRWITHCYEGLQSSLARYQVLYLNLPGANAPALTEHEEILALLERGESAPAKARMTAHLARTRRCLLANMPGEGPAQDTPQDF